MALPTGLAASVGMVAESTYGTYVTPTRFLPFTSHRLQKVKNVYQGGGLRGGTYAQPGAQRYVTTEAGAGPLVMEVLNKNLGLLLNNLMGGTVTPTQQGGTAAYLATFPLDDPTGKKLTIQAGVPDLAGTVNDYSFLGCKVVAAEFACQLGGHLTVTFEIDARQVVESESLAAPSYASGLRTFHFAQSSIELGTYDSESEVSGIRGMTLRIARPSSVDRYYHGNAGLKAEPLLNGWTEVTGTFETDFITKADFADRYAADSATALDWIFTGPNIASTFDETFRIRVPQIYMDGETPTVQGPGNTQSSHPFRAQYDGTNALVTVSTISTDTTL